jgi:hypothetical protein
MSQEGRIGGPLLAQNLLRNGTDLSFETSLLYFNVGSQYLGINTQGPSSDLTIGTVKNNGGTTNSKIGTVNLRVDTTANIGNFTIGTSTIQHLTSSITVTPASSGTSVTPGLSTSNLYSYGNSVTNTVTNDSINISPNGTGQINFANGVSGVDVTVNAGLHATGNITWDGNITLGNQTTDTITFAAEVNSDILPQVLTSLITPVTEQILTEALDLFITEDAQPLFTDPAAPYYATTYLYSLGSNSLQWNNVYANTLTSIASGVTSAIVATNMNLGNFYLNKNTISNVNNDINFAPTGTGRVTFNDWQYINGGTINTGVNTLLPKSLLTQNSTLFIGMDDEALLFNKVSYLTPLTLASTGNGYVKLTGKTGFVLPVGRTTGPTKRPVKPETGATRWNTELQYIEIYNGTTWIPAYGVATNATLTDINDFSTLYSIVFGY